MQQTTNYNLNLPEGTDVVNPLVDYNPNFSTIDSAMKANADRTVGRATCIKSGTTHVVTRSNTGSNIINFTATGDWNEGDTMTIDSTIVSVFLPDGSAALDGAYLINSEVFGILNGTRFTLYSNITELTAAATSYNNTGSGLNANNVQDAIDEVKSEINSLASNQALNSFGTAVSLTLDTDYTCPSDGYFTILCYQTAVNYAFGYVNGATLMLNATSQNSAHQGSLVSSIFVRRGMIIKFSGTTNSTGTFRPLV